MGQAINRRPSREMRFGSYDLIGSTDPSMDLHLRLLAEVASDAVYDAACRQVLADKNRKLIADFKRANGADEQKA